MQKNYTASLGTSAVITTACIIILFVSMVMVALLTQPTEKLGALILASILFFACAGFYLFRPLGYVMDGVTLVVRRPIGNVVIPINQIRKATAIRKETLNNISMVGGVCGYFGYFGEWKTPFGPTRWFATRLDNFLLIETAEENIIITPDNTDMVKHIRERCEIFKTIQSSLHG